MKCKGCGGDFKRDDIVPPKGVRPPPSIGYRCRPCHGKRLSGEFKAAAAFQMEQRRNG